MFFISFLFTSDIDFIARVEKSVIVVTKILRSNPFHTFVKLNFMTSKKKKKWFYTVAAYLLIVLYTFIRSTLHLHVNSIAVGPILPAAGNNGRHHRSDVMLWKRFTCVKRYAVRNGSHDTHATLSAYRRRRRRMNSLVRFDFRTLVSVIIIIL